MTNGMTNVDRYDPAVIELKWQRVWNEQTFFQAEDFSKRQKAYLLFEFPYPSGDGLHVGHCRPYSAMDALARKRRMEGQNVLFPIGWDAFGLPTENYALKTDVHPRVATDTNIATFRRQMKALGLSLDWSREVDTTDPNYYRWTQWLFLQFFKKGLAYQATMPINWCPKDKIGLANEEVVGGKCERCGTEVTKKLQKQWLLKITAYAERLLKDLDTVDYPERIKTQQVNWIGKSEGAEIEFRMTSDELRKRRFVLLHGFNGTAEGIFFPWLKKELEAAGHEVIAPNLPNPTNPTEAEQVGFVLKNVPLDAHTVLFGHSLGAVVALKVVERLKKPIAGLVLAGGFTEAKFKDKPRPFQKTFSWDFDFAAVKKKISGPITVLRADRDYAVPAEATAELAAGLGVPVIDVHVSKPHFTGIEEPTILEALCPSIRVFTTRPDTLFGATYVVLAPEHPMIENYKLQITNYKKIRTYIEKAAKKSDLDRTDLAKEKTGVELKGITAVNPANNERIPIWVADYVLLTYGTGAIMAVPAHDERDFEFARKFGLPIKRVIEPKFVAQEGRDTSVKPDLPFVKRDAVCAIIRDPKNHTYLCVSWKPFPMHGLVTGGLEGDEDPVEAALREIHEETGYKNVRFVNNPEFAIQVQFYHRVKKQNRWARFQYLFFELENDERGEVDEKESLLHDVVWKSENELKDFFTVFEGEFILNFIRNPDYIHTGEGVLHNSGSFDDFDSPEARKKIVAELEKRGLGKSTVQYKLRDWVFSRQHYWGEPIPIIHCPEHGAVPVPEDQLPVELPYVEKYQPTGTGESPLAAITDWVNTTCPICAKPAKRETDTMPNWAGSSWYFLRYTDPKNALAFADQKKLKYWLPVDLYEGGMEHTTLHLLYSRFWHKFLFDEGLVPTAEPYAKRRSHGIVLAEDGRKMSKSFGNVINPDAVIKEYGADTLRIYEMFMGPFEDAIPWSTKGIVGVRRFLEKVWRLQEKSQSDTASADLTRLLHRTIKKVGDDLEAFKFNTAVSALMILANVFDKERALHHLSFFVFVRLLKPFAPHLAAELLERHFPGKIEGDVWPPYDARLLVSDTVTVIVQVNGRRRGQISLPRHASEAEAVAAARQSPGVKKYVPGEPKRVVYVPDKLLNLVV